MRGGLPKLRVTVEVRIYASNMVETLVDAIKPDNVGIPQGMRLCTRIDEESGNYLKIRVDHHKIPPLLNTLNDLFSCIQPAFKLLSELTLQRHG
ncbi:MAG: KEOPS complex subunit Pcc1 [Candidatus Nezhaarchaeota archaeon]|nr:KEOPS complex subunit Pcc1 [Candidatus Nezhaarchaeota archaeon]